MFERLVAWFNSLWDRQWQVIQIVYEYIRKFSVTIWGLIIIFVTLTKTVFEFVKNGVLDAVFALDAILTPAANSLTNSGLAQGSAGGPLWQLFITCNTFCPLQELFAYLAIQFTLLTALSIYRLIRSFIPIPTAR